MANILVVDDDPNVCFFLEEMLKKEGHAAVVAHSKESAVRLLQEQEFDLVLVDIKLKKASGLDILTLLQERWPDTVAIVLTAYASLETAVAALRQGARDYLFKPCRTVELRESVREGLLDRERRLHERRLLQRLQSGALPAAGNPWPAHAEAVLSDKEPDRFIQYQGIIVDSMRHVITLDGHLLELSPTEFDLLAYLVSEAPRVIPVNELLREIRDANYEEADDILRYHIYRIRRKIKAATGQTDIIRNVRGVGYTIG